MGLTISEIFIEFKQKKCNQNLAPDLSISTFRWPYKPIWEVFYIFKKYKNNNFSWLTISEIFFEFKQKECN